MELSYMVRGADGKHYGPASLELLGGWVREGRLRPQSELKRSDMEHWAPAEDFAELQPLFAVPATASAAAPAAPTVAAQTAQAAARLKSGASWFYWIAGLSLVNTLASYGGLGFRFIIGLGITQLIDSYGSRNGGAGVPLVFDVLAAGVFILFGVFAHKSQAWAFIVGMALFALDTALCLVLQSWLDVIVHAFILYCLFRGFIACRQMNAR